MKTGSLGDWQPRRRSCFMRGMKTSEEKPAVDDDREFLKAVGAAVRDARRRLDLTQEQLSVRLDTTAEWISQIERGVGTPSVTTFIRLSAALDVSPAELMETASAGRHGQPDVAHLVAEAQRLPPAAVRSLVELAKSMRAWIVDPAAQR